MNRNALALISLLLVATNANSAAISDTVPDGIKCDLEAIAGRPGGQVFLYLGGLTDDGRSIYNSLGPRNITLVFSAEGVPIGGAKTLCDGLSLEELKTNGQTFDFGSGSN